MMTSLINKASKGILLEVAQLGSEYIVPAPCWISIHISLGCQGSPYTGNTQMLISVRICKDLSRRVNSFDNAVYKQQ